MDLRFSSLIAWLLIVLVCQGSRCQDSDQDSLNFIAIADWGGINEPPYKSDIQKQVAQGMAKIAGRHHVSFILSLGDHFYDYGVTDVDDPRFKQTFEEVYYYESLNIPWYMVLGNHDYEGNVKAQLDYGKHSWRWRFPDYYYKLTKKVPGGKTLDIILLDTVIMCGVIWDNYQPGPRNPIEAEKEWEWLEEQLKKSTAEYLLVVGHYPVHSVGYNGPTRLLISRLEPMLLKYNVNAYVSGHDHNVQHIQMGQGGKMMDYFITGGTTYVSTSMDHRHTLPWTALRYRFSNSRRGCFTMFEVTDRAMTVKVFNGHGFQRYQYDLFPRTKTNI